MEMQGKMGTMYIKYIRYSNGEKQNREKGKQKGKI